MFIQAINAPPWGGGGDNGLHFSRHDDFRQDCYQWYAGCDVQSKSVICLRNHALHLADSIARYNTAHAALFIFHRLRFRHDHAGRGTFCLPSDR